MTLINLLLRRREWHLHFYQDCGWAAMVQSVPLGNGRRSDFQRELHAIGGRQMLMNRGYLAGGTEDFVIRPHSVLDTSE